ncbi:MULTISPECIES: hypothetical protein [Methylobacterium]|jgi:hypothetical protein|uniref:Cysteine rich repeat protein n=1 Tax=Methylobacterium isbiliense TaxID=315478 RepID=A0ABQ4SJU6_9HYPH|nr:MULTISPECIES: hypothetical protein [Methylobacterium]MBY0299300.1 hypothetical protein [Methylobacterium sp.]MDN3624047.1 hypothetical protein [Methylobacterium isbiliense]GJE03452.1 hypothetical protein GMJLKIPL_5407 [Methylobacterium isbiliense]
MCRSITQFCATLLLVTSAGASLAADGTAAQRAACTPDVFRLCSSEIPDVGRIKACLRRERQNLSTSCQAVFNELDRAASPRPTPASVKS